MAKRPSPMLREKQRGTATGQAGNYASAVDTTGMDEEMKKTMNIGTKKSKKKGLIGWMKEKMGIKY